MINLLLDGVFSDEAVDTYVALLADPERTLCRLNVYHWIPVRVKDDHFVGCRQVYPETAHSCCQQKDSQAVLLSFVL